MTKQEEKALLARVDVLEALVQHRGSEIKRLEARLEALVRQHDVTIQMHCDHALTMRQLSGAIEDLVRRGTR